MIPESWSPNVKIIIPYRDRPAMLKHWKDIPNKLIVELANTGPWNREVLFNVGIKETVEMFLVFNDIDHIPLSPYIPRLGVTQLVTSDIQKHDYLGGVTMIDRLVLLKVGGFHNDFWGGRGGDNEMRFTLKRHTIPVALKPHRFKILHHERPAMEFVKEMWIKAQKVRQPAGQYQILKYDKEYIADDHIKVFIRKWKLYQYQ